MITYREATVDDVSQIAQLHTLSWQQNYSGIWRDEFLQGNLIENRLTVWENRIRQPDDNQYIIVSEIDHTLCGFACAYADEDPVWGTLLDNLHVSSVYKGQGIGTYLIRSAARWAYEQAPQAGFYLWVLEQNGPARAFYDHLGGINQEVVLGKNPGGGFSNKCRYIWPDLKRLID